MGSFLGILLDAETEEFKQFSALKVLYCNVPSEARAIWKVGSRAERGVYMGPEGH